MVCLYKTQAQSNWVSHKSDECYRGSGEVQMTDHLSIFPGQRLDANEAVTVISKLRRKYHQGLAENNVLSPEELQKYLERARKRGYGRQKLPDDIREYRILHYGEPLEELPFASGGIALTWGVFPATTIPTNFRIFSHPHFLAYQMVYFSWLTLGDYVSEVSPPEVEAFFENVYTAGMGNLYVFDKDLKWCISIYDGAVLITGDFKIF
jgi:hypothetical protein